MKKSLTAALTTALVIGAASTTFAAANPFSDVPEGHWAYDAVAQLADDGIIEGYGDSTYRGQQAITRYEMAQLVAKAMAKEDRMSAQQKAMVDRLAAEFRDELNNLGVRVAHLERNADRVKWTGELRATYAKTTGDFVNKYEGGAQKDHELLLRLEPEAAVSAHWTVKSRLDAAFDPTRDDAKGENGDKVSLKRLYAEGAYGSAVVDIGKLPVYTEQGVLIDDDMSGVAVTLGAEKKFFGTVAAGRYGLGHSAWGGELQEAQEAGMDADGAANLQLVNLNWNPSEKFHIGADYVRMQNESFVHNVAGMDKVCHFWGLGAAWRPDRAIALSGGYWKNSSAESQEIKAEHLKAYHIELAYKGAKPEDPHTFGLHLAYRYLGGGCVIAPTFDGAMWNTKGWELGGTYTFAKHVVGTLIYFTGDQIYSAEPEGKTSQNKLFGRIEYFF